MYEQTLDLDGRRRLQRLVLLPLQLGYDGPSPRQHRRRACFQPPSPGDFRKARLRGRHTPRALMVALLYLAWLYVRELAHRSKQSSRHWRRYSVDLPVRVSVRNGAGAHAISTPGRGTAVSGGGMALYVDLPLKRDDAVEVEFQIPSKLLVAGIVPSRREPCVGLEFLTPL